MASRPKNRFRRHRAVARPFSLRSRDRRGGVVSRSATFEPAAENSWLVDERKIPLRRLVPPRPCVAVDAARERRSDPTQSWCRTGSCSTGRASQAGAGNHVGQRCASHEQVPRRRSSRCCGTSVRRERAALATVRQPFKDAFGPHCFYCGTHLPANNPIDHVLPWSLVGIDGLSNLVLACARCNGDKSGALPTTRIVGRVLARERDVLEEIASALQWPTQHERVVAATRGIYRGQPAGLPTWSGYKQSERLDVSFRPRWV